MEQVHYFTSPEAGKLLVKVNWRVARANGQFYERSDLQRFVQDPARPGLLLNRGNEMLHYEDDWYVVGFKKDVYVLIYYRGRNDAWDGYGGAVLYTRAAALGDLKAELPEIKAAVAAANLKWKDFKATDNSCGPQPPLRVAAPTDLDVLADDVVALEREGVRDVQALEKGAERALERVEDGLTSFSRNFTVLGRAKPFRGSISLQQGDPLSRMRMSAKEKAAIKRLETSWAEELKSREARKNN